MPIRFKSIVGLGAVVVVGGAALLPGCGETTHDVNENAGRASATGGAGSGGGAATGGASGNSQHDGGGSGGVSGSANVSTAGDESVESGGTGHSGTSAGHTGNAGGKAGTNGAGAPSNGGASEFGGAGEENGGGGASGECDPGGTTTVTAMPVVPTVELLVDTSSSMFETYPTTTWSILYDALMNPDSGVVKPLEHQMRFGFLSYKGYVGTSETDPACATMTAVAPALDNYAAIDSVYTSVGANYSTAGPLWETPTNYAIWYATNLLVADTADVGPKYIVLATDGNPNTCETLDPQCGQDRAIKAAQDAHAAGIGLLVLGVGDIIAQPNSGCPPSVRCGELHLQDLANAGVGAPVAPPPNCDDPTSDTCSARFETCNDRTLIASYTPAATDVGTPFAVDTSAADAATKLRAALSSLLSGAISCTVPIDVGRSAKSRLEVSVGGTARQQEDPDGWVLEADGRHITLEGRACIDFKALEPLTLDLACP